MRIVPEGKRRRLWTESRALPDQESSKGSATRLLFLELLGDELSAGIVLARYLPYKFGVRRAGRSRR
jgi:hypothetical protein